MMKVRAFIHQWEMVCWKCGESTPVLWAFRPPTNQKEAEFEGSWLGAYEVTPEQDLAMGEVLCSKFEWYRKGHSYTMGETVYASFCKSCDSLQGNWYVLKDLIEQRSNGVQPDFKEHVDYDTEHDAEKFLME